MMLKYVPRIDAYLWFATAFWQIVVAFVVLRPSFRRAYPAFSSFALFAAVRTPILMILPAGVYFLGYAVGTTATSLLMGATLFEIYTRVCGPRFSLPSWVPRTMASWLALAITVSGAATWALYSVRVLEQRAAILAATQGGILMVLSMALVILVCYSKYLRMEWRLRPRQIAAGLGLHLIANSVVLLFLPHVAAQFMHLADRSGQVATNLALIWWTFALRKPEPPPEVVTQEMMDTILAFHQETIKAAESAGLIHSANDLS